MSKHKFELDDIRKMQMMKINCSHCQPDIVKTCALVFHDQMTVERDSQEEQDIIAIFCQGDCNKCEGSSWAFPVSDDNALIAKHNALTTVTTNN